ncbi:MAG TPA: diguanylate cyclase [Pirellulales bacterium]|nr:diguanylate cyclase [Pirellulales bacterium]
MHINLLNRVLVADDDPAILRLLESLLQASGYEVFSASDGRQALEMIERHQPSYLITDWNMPEMNGIELCCRVRHLDLPSYIYIVFLTVRSAEDDLTAAMDAGADDFLIKPLRRDELMARLGAGARILRLESRLSQLAALDALTELPTRRTFHELLAKEWQRSHRYQLALSAVMIDIDFFKPINDTHGHPAGDEVIRGVVRLLRRNCRRSDLICRYGGEEFVALLPETDEASAMIWAERFRRHVAEMVTVVGNAEIRATVSLGVAQMLADMEEKSELLSLADQCLLAAKQRGRNRVESAKSLTAGGSLSPTGGSFGGSVLDGVAAREAMIPMVCCAAADWTIQRVTAHLLQYQVSSVPVTDPKGNLLGIISEKDILVVAHTPEAPNRRVDEIMRANVITFDLDVPLARVLSCFIRSPIRSVVVTSQGKPCGMISRASIVRWFLDNRWAVRLIQRGLQKTATATETAHAEANSPTNLPDKNWIAAEALARPNGQDPSLESLARELAQMASDLQSQLSSNSTTPDMQPIAGSASRMQALLDELLAGAPTR